MTTPLRVILVVGFLLLGLIAIYPPLKRPVTPPGKMEFGETEWPFGQRALLFIDDYVYGYSTPDQRVGHRTEIDAARLLGEALVILAATGVAVMLLLPKPEKRAPD